MPSITIHTEISAPLERVFDLARSIDLHSISVSETKEKAIAGRTSGCIEKGETVTWEAVHFGVKQRLTSIISELIYPTYFVDEMTKGIFKSIHHQHIFTKQENGLVKMTDIFRYESPLGVIGKIADVIFLEKYLYKFLKKRNDIIKSYAESDLWKSVLK